MKSVATILLALIIVLPVLLVLNWLIWQFYLWLMPIIWTTAPQAVLTPSYGVFLGWLILLSFIGRFFRGSK